MFQFYIDGIEVNDPANWMDFTESIQYDETKKVYFFKYEQLLLFSGQAYKYLYEKFNSVGFCYQATILVEQKCGSRFEQIFSGYILISDCVFNPSKCIVECPVVDDSMTSLLFNNIGIDVDLYNTGVVTKNGVALSVGTLAHSRYGDPNTSMFSIFRMFNPIGGAYDSAGSGTIIYLYDAFNLIVKFVTDQQCEFESDTLNYVVGTHNARYLGVGGGTMICPLSGLETPDCIVSFETLFIALSRLYDVSIGISVSSNGKPLIRIEETAYFRQDITGLVIDDVNEFTQKINVQQLYSKVKVGGTQIHASDTISTAFIDTPSNTFAIEQYYIKGQCNINRELNLAQDKIIIDTNILELMYQQCNSITRTAYDDNIFFVEIEPQDPLDPYPYESVQAIQTIDIDNANYHYNDGLLNKNIIQRHPLANNARLLYSEGGDVPVSKNPLVYFNSLIQYEYPLDKTRYDTYKQNLYNNVRLNDRMKIWLSKTTRNFATGDMTWEMTTNLNNI